MTAGPRIVEAPSEFYIAQGLELTEAKSALEIPRALIADPTLSVAAIGLLTILLSYPRGTTWKIREFRNKYLKGVEYRTALIEEVIRSPYVKLGQRRNYNGTLSPYQYHVKSTRTEEKE